jgi:hypothetical protein
MARGRLSVLFVLFVKFIGQKELDRSIEHLAGRAAKEAFGLRGGVLNKSGVIDDKECVR